MKSGNLLLQKAKHPGARGVIKAKDLPKIAPNVNPEQIMNTPHVDSAKSVNHLESGSTVTHVNSQISTAHLVTSRLAIRLLTARHKTQPVLAKHFRDV